MFVLIILAICVAGFIRVIGVLYFSTIRIFYFVGVLATMTTLTILPVLDHLASYGVDENLSLIHI